MESKFSKGLKRSFSTGLVVLLPFAATIWIIVWLLKSLEALLIKPLFQADWIKQFFSVLPEILIPWIQALIGLAIIFIVISALGWLASNFLGKWFLGKFDWIMTKMPLASTVYTFVKGLIENLRVMRSGYFKKVVLVEYPRKGIWSIGFVSRDLTGAIQTSSDNESMAVFIPTSPNPTSGYIIVIDKTEAQQLDISPEEALKFIVSGGVVMPGAAVEPDKL